MPARKGSSSIAGIPPAILAQLNAGTLETATLAEGLAIDFPKLLRAAFPTLSNQAFRRAEELKAEGVTRRMAGFGAILLDELGLDHLPAIQQHRSDTVRGWGCYMAGLTETVELPARLELIRPFADDRHFGVREWAWMPIRPHLAADLTAAVRLLKPWVRSDSENLRRFAIESLRPRGVWTTRIRALAEAPEFLLLLLEPLKCDGSRYVQLSVANWLNDASKSRPDWVTALCERWLRESPTAATQAICARALRTIRQVKS